MNKQTVVYPHNRILFRNRKEWTANPYNNRDESETVSKWKPKSKGYIL